MRSFIIAILTLAVSIPAYAKYSGGSGTAQDPYRIATAEDLIALGETPEDYNKHFILTEDIDLAGHVFDKAVIAPDTNDTKYGFQGTPFTGVFDGKGHTISHLTVQGEGLFGQLGEWPLFVGEVKDLGVVDVNIMGSDDRVGALVGVNNGDVTQCYSTGTVGGAEYVGGLIGISVGRGAHITSSYSTAMVSGSGSSVGGLAGYNEGTVTNCYSASRVTGKDCVGGLVGSHGRFDWGGTVTNCHSTGAVKGGECVGGLVGYNSWGLVSQSYSTGGVNGTREVGGVVGCNEGGVDYCYSTGTVSGGDSVGGLVGNNLEDVFRCYSSGVVDGNDYVGGLVGKNFSGNVMRCESASTVDGNSYVGGLVGMNGWREDSVWGTIGSLGVVSDCYSTGGANGTKYVGGLVGYHNTGFVTRCYSTGAVDGSESVGGLVAYAAYDEWTGVAGCFWDIQTSGRTRSAGGTGKTTAEMQTASTFLNAGWDFVNVWGIGENQTYPYLRKYSAADVNQDGSVDFLDLATFAANWLAATE